MNWRTLSGATLIFATLSMAAFSTNTFAELAETPDVVRNDAALAEYFAAETSELQSRCLADIDSAETWREKRPEYKRQLLEMLGLDPLPEKTDLQVTFTGEVEHDDFVVRKLHYQSRPGLYVTANLYMPRNVEAPLPAVLYVCGHGKVNIDGVSYGNKVHYQHHPAWFARNGYVCLTIDTLQLGEIEGTHHGTHREGMWWWLNRGYTPAGVEAWNGVRAIDFLQTLPEVDGDRIGITGRSGGGAYSWWVAAIDERIKCAVPVAGVTDLQNHVVDGCVEGHCDCMFMVNTYRWDYPLLAAMIAPRPLLISNSDSDTIFPLNGVYRTYEKVKRIYKLLDAEQNVALNITAGPHQDTQELRVHAFRWLNQHLKSDVETLVQPTQTFFTPQQLKVLKQTPSDQQNTQIHEHFVATAQPSTPTTSAEWVSQRHAWMKTLRGKVFAGWPTDDVPLNVSEVSTDVINGKEVKTFEFDSQHHVRITLRIMIGSDTSSPVELRLLDENNWPNWQNDVSKSQGSIAFFAPRGVGETSWTSDERTQTQIRRRFYLLGQTLDGQRVYDVMRAIQTLSQLPQTQDRNVTVLGSGTSAGLAVYAALFSRTVTSLELHNLPITHRAGPTFLNVRKHFDMPHAVAMALTDKRVTLTGNTITWKADAGAFPREVAKLLGRSGELIYAASDEQ